MRWWHSLNCTVQNQDAEAAEMTARLKRLTSNRLKHPITGWSSRDLQTILKEPLGSTPENVGWSVSIVITPVGWIGRIDNYVKGIHKDLEIEPTVADIYKEIRELEKARAPFHYGGAGERDGSRVLEAGARPQGLFDEGEYTDEIEDYDYEFRILSDDELEEDDESEFEYGDIVTALEELVRTNNPQTVTLADLCETWGVDWRAYDQRKKR
jgi:hypothetical protein